MGENRWSILLASVWLLAVSAADIRSRRVPVWLLIAGSLGAVLMMFYRLYNNMGNCTGMFWSVLPGIVLLAAALMTKKVGCGDGIVFLLLGMLLEDGKGVMLFGFSLFLISIWSLILLTLRKAGKSSRIPYLPFLTVSWFLIVYTA